MHMCEQDLGLNNRQRLIWCKTQPTNHHFCCFFPQILKNTPVPIFSFFFTQFIITDILVSIEFIQERDFFINFFFKLSPK